MATESKKFAAQIKEATECLDASIEAFNARNIPAYEASLNFPSVRLASNNLAILRNGSHGPQMYNRSGMEDWDHSSLDRKKVIHAGEDKVHFDIRLIHFRKDGSVLATFDALYVVTKENGHWGIKVRSSYAP